MEYINYDNGKRVMVNGTHKLSGFVQSDEALTTNAFEMICLHDLISYKALDFSSSSSPRTVEGDTWIFEYTVYAI